MTRYALLATLAALLLMVGCTVTAPGGMGWDEYHAARYAMQVSHDQASVAGCQAVGQVRGESLDDIGAAKEEAIDKALVLGANHLVFDHLTSEYFWYKMLNQDEIYYAYATGYRCLN